jgi:hypothetical protein
MKAYYIPYKDTTEADYATALKQAWGAKTDAELRTKLVKYMKKKETDVDVGAYVLYEWMMDPQRNIVGTCAEFTQPNEIGRIIFA